MPNWCTTTYRFHGKPNEIVLLHDNIVKWTSRSFEQTDFGNAWLGNILHGAGLHELVEVRGMCRGTIVSVGDIEWTDAFDVYTETAWQPCAKMWKEVIKKLNLKSVDFCYIAEEPGCGLYLIYDPKGCGYFDSSEVCISGETQDENLYGYYTVSEAVFELNRILGTDKKELSELMEVVKKYNENNESFYIDVNIFEHTSEDYCPF